MPTGARIDFVYPANYAEAINGLVYTAGGGWTNLYRQIPAEGQQLTQMGIVAGLTVPWMEIGNPHEVVVQIKPVTSFGVGEPFVTVKAQIRIGPQRHTQEWTNERVMLGVPVAVIFPKAGVYELSADVDENGEAKTWEFRVHDGTSSG